MRFLTDASEFVYYRTYSRWRDDLGRRETWEETVQRYVDFISSERGALLPAKILRQIQARILAFDVMPSMRLLWSAGEAARKNPLCGYNCSFIPVDSIEAFSEMLYVLTCGTGGGFSVEKHNIEKLPIVKITPAILNPRTHVIVDTREGWADSVKLLMEHLYLGDDIAFDYSDIRPRGARLVTMGGRASGPEPLVILHNFIREVFSKAQGRRLTSLECHDIMNQIAEVVVVGGVRRSSQISLSDLDDKEIRDCKVWPFPLRRSMANNSAVYYEKPDAVSFLKEWSALAASGTGERGISNLGSARKKSPERRDSTRIEGFNPCHEIALRPLQLCNLTSVVIRPHDDLDELLEKVEIATWIGTIQASFTDFPYLRPQWKQNCDEEALLGVSLSGQMDNPQLLTEDALKVLKSRAGKINKKASKILGINAAAAIGCVKPEGTASQVCFSGSGIHPWYSDYFIRRYRISANDPLYMMLKSQGFRLTPENGQTPQNATTWVIAFPMKAPETAVTKDKLTALQQLDWYKKIQTHWCEHNASMTVYVKDHEWFEVGNWVYKNWDLVNGLSFLPFDGGKYEQPPLEEISKELYEQMVDSLPKIDYTKLALFEKEDFTEGSKTLACSGGACEL